MQVKFLSADGADVLVEIGLSRAEWRDALSSVWARFNELLTEALAQAQLSAGDIGVVHLGGGQAAAAPVLAALRKRFGANLNIIEQPAAAAAKGAATMAASLLQPAAVAAALGEDW